MPRSIPVGFGPWWRGSFGPTRFSGRTTSREKKSSRSSPHVETRCYGSVSCCVGSGLRDCGAACVTGDQVAEPHRPTGLTCGTAAPVVVGLSRAVPHSLGSRRPVGGCVDVTPANTAGVCGIRRSWRHTEAMRDLVIGVQMAGEYQTTTSEAVPVFLSPFPRRVSLRIRPASPCVIGGAVLGAVLVEDLSTGLEHAHLAHHAMAWITHHRRRCARDHERLPHHHEAMIRITSQRLQQHR
jgi:hypothetical protein